MSKRDIERALRKKGITAEHIEFVWVPEPGEMVPCWEVHLSDADADKFGVDHMNLFDSTAQTLDWVNELEPYTEETSHD
jgi:hypothetical protein